MRPPAHIALFLLLLPCVSSASQTSDASLQRDDFARGMELTPLTSSPVQTLLLSEEVYRGLSSSRLHDLRVFNARGEEVPHAVRTLIDIQETDHGSVALPLFAIHAKDDEDAPLGDMSLQLVRSDDGRVLEVTTRSESPSERDSEPLPIVAYILDLGSLDRPCIALNLPLPEELPSFLCTYAVEASADLSTWSTLVPQATLASLDHGGTRLVRTQVPLPPTKMPYLRLRWLDGGPPLQLEKAVLDLQNEVGIAKRSSVVLNGARREGEEQVFDYPSPGPLPVNRIQLELPATNTLIEAEVKTAPAKQGPWNTLLKERFFRISNKVELRNDPYSVRTHSAKFWALHVAPQGGGVGQGLPRLVLEYFPHQLAFVARGEGPFTLAFGKHGAGAASFNWQAVTDILTTEQRAALPYESVTKGAIFDIAGDSALNAPLVNEHPKKIILWTILIVGVAVLASLSWKLVRKVD